MIIAELTSSLDPQFKESHSITKHSNFSLDNAFKHCLAALGVLEVEWKPMVESDDCYLYEGTIPETFNTIKVTVFK